MADIIWQSLNIYQPMGKMFKTILLWYPLNHLKANIMGWMLLGWPSASAKYNFFVCIYWKFQDGIMAVCPASAIYLGFFFVLIENSKMATTTRETIIGPYTLQFLICDKRWVQAGCIVCFWKVKSVHKQFRVNFTFIFRKRIRSVTFCSLIRLKKFQSLEITLCFITFLFQIFILYMIIL